MMQSFIHICNPFTPELKGFQNIVSKKQMDEVNNSDNNVYLVHIHLNWEGSKLSSNYGFDIANLLRTEKQSKAPIIFYSPIQQRYFEKKSKKEIKYKILFGRGSAFKQLPLVKDDLIAFAKKMEPLSNAALHDVVTMLCDLKGIVIDKLNHDLKFECDIDSVIASVSPYLSPLQKRAIELDKFIAEIKVKVKDNDIAGFRKERQKFITVCNLELTEAGKDKPKDKKYKHKILILDDVPAEVENTRLQLEEEFTIIETNTGEKAKEILATDTRNEIIALIADWRLFTDTKQDYWQPTQGYEVLEYAAKNGIRSLFALTSQADFIVHQLRNVMGIRFSVFKKENLEKDGQWKVFSDVLSQACEDAIRSRAFILDDFPTWNKVLEKKGVEQPSLRQQYIDFWNAVDRDARLNKIEKKADEIWAAIMNDTSPFAILTKFADYAISHKVYVLIKTLVCRRIWLGLWFNYLPEKRFDSSKLSQVVHKILFGDPAPGVVAQRTFLLCIQLDKINERYMFPEEIDWLKRRGLLE